MTSNPPTGSQPDPPDARRNPRRGVRVKPLPRYMHREFRGLCADATRYIRSQLSTWRLADRETHGEQIVQANLIYWEAALRWMTHLEYFGTANDTGKRP